jgi:hypothetical protein
MKFKYYSIEGQGMKQAITSTARLREIAHTETPRLSWQQLWAAGVAKWKLSPGLVALISFGAPLLIMFVGAATALFGKETYKWFTGEDGASENLQVLFWVLAWVAGFKVIGRLWKNGLKLYAGLYLLLNAGIFFIIGEEISWGQRIFDWETSAEMKAINKQEETNLHNIEGVGDKIKWVHVIMGAYGTILPLVLMGAQVRAHYGDPVSLLVPHYTLVPYFLTTLLWRLQANLWKPPKSLYFVITEYSEVMELVLAAAFFVFMLFQVRNIKTAAKILPNREEFPLNRIQKARE